MIVGTWRRAYRSSSIKKYVQKNEAVVTTLRRSLRWHHLVIYSGRRRRASNQKLDLLKPLTNTTASRDHDAFNGDQLSGKGMSKISASRIASVIVAASTSSNLRKAARTDAGGPLSNNARGGGRKSNISSILVARENIT